MNSLTKSKFSIYQHQNKYKIKFYSFKIKISIIETASDPKIDTAFTLWIYLGRLFLLKRLVVVISPVRIEIFCLMSLMKAFIVMFSFGCLLSGSYGINSSLLDITASIGVNTHSPILDIGL